MQVKKFLVNDMSEAMPLIRAELGPEAVILHSEKAPEAGFRSWFARPKLQVIAAVDQDQRDFPQPTSATDRSIQAMQQEISVLKASLARNSLSSRESHSLSPGVSPLRPTEPAPRSAPLDDWYRRLLDCGLIEPVAQRLIQTTGETLSRWALDNSDLLGEQMRWQLSRQLSVAPVAFNASYDAVHFLVGPTGVGKTTTVAKLPNTSQTGNRSSLPSIRFGLGLSPKSPPWVNSWECRSKLPIHPKSWPTRSPVTGRVTSC